MRRSLSCGALGALLIACPGAGAKTATPPTSMAASAAPGVHAPASAPAPKKQTNRVKTPPGNPPGGGPCSQGTKAQRQRCLYDMYGPSAPRI